MPPAIGAAILTAAGVADATIVSGLTLSAVVGYSVTTAAPIGAQLALEALSQPRAASQQLTVRQALAPRVRGHGRGKLGGAVAVFEVQGGQFWRVVAHCVGPISQIREYWGADLNLGLSGSGGTPNNPWRDALFVTGFLGAPDQSMAAALGPLGAAYVAHHFRGLVCTIERCLPSKKGEKKFPEGPPPIRIVADLVPCPDVRNPGAPWRWSDNPADCIAEYLMHESGFDLDASELNWDSFAAFANLCDQDVPKADGSTVKRYRTWNTYDYTEPKAKVLARLLAACDGRLSEDRLGRVTLTGGRYVEPTVIITEDMILGWDDYTSDAPAAEAVNRMGFSFTSPAHDYQPTQGDPFVDADALASAGGQAYAADREFRACPDHSQGRRLCKIELARLNPAHRFAGLRVSFAGLDAMGEDFVRLRLPSLGIDASFEIGRFAFDPATRVCSMDVSALGAAAYAWSPIEEGTPPAPLNVTVPAAPPLPSGVSYVVERTIVAGAVTALAVRFHANDPGDASLSLAGEFRRVGDVDFADLSGAGVTAVAAGLSDGIAYEARLLWEGPASIGPITALIPFSAVADEAAPAAPTDFGASVSGGTATLSWRGSPSPNAQVIEVLRATSGQPVTAAAVVRTLGNTPSAQAATTDAPAPGSWTYWLRARNGSGVPSGLAGPVSVTV